MRLILVFFSVLFISPMAFATPKSIVGIWQLARCHQRGASSLVSRIIDQINDSLCAFREVQSGIVTMNSPVKVSRKALSKPPSKMGYPAGSRMTLENALKMIIVKSANDIAVAIGECFMAQKQLLLMP